jgi:hypothetical protein
VIVGSAGISRRRHSTGSLFSTMQVGALLKACSVCTKGASCRGAASKAGGMEITKVQSEPSRNFTRSFEATEGCICACNVQQTRAHAVNWRWRACFE